MNGLIARIDDAMGIHTHHTTLALLADCRSRILDLTRDLEEARHLLEQTYADRDRLSTAFDRILEDSGRPTVRVPRKPVDDGE